MGARLKRDQANFAHATNIEKLGYNQDLYEMLKEEPGWVDADAAFRTILEQRYEYSLAGQALAELGVTIERAKTGGSTTFDALSEEVKTRNQQADDPNIFVPTPVRFYEAGQASKDQVMGGYQQVPAVFAHNALGCHERWSVIEVAGYSDDLGDKDVQEAVSRKRAEAVMELLVEAGIPKARIRVVAKGYAAPPEVVDGEIEALKKKISQGQSSATTDAALAALVEARRPYRRAVVVALP